MEVGTLLGEKALLNGLTYASDTRTVGSNLDYFTYAEKVAKKAAYDTAIEAVKAASTSKEVREAEMKLTKTLTALTASYDVNYATIYNNYNIVITGEEEDKYLLENYGILDFSTATTYSSATDNESLDGIVLSWMIDNGYVKATDITKGVNKMIASMKGETLYKTAMNAELRAINLEIADMNAGSNLQFGSAVATYAGLDDVEALLAKEDEFLSKYGTGSFTALSSNVTGNVVALLADKMLPTAAAIKALPAYTLRTDEDKANCVKYVVDFYNQVSALEDAYPYLDDAGYIGTAKTTALDWLNTYSVWNETANTPNTTVNELFGKESADLYALANTANWVFTGPVSGVYSFDSSAANLDKIAKIRAGYDALVAKYGYTVVNKYSWLDEARLCEAYLLAAEYNAKAVAGYDKKDDTNNSIALQNLLNNATLKVTTKALGNSKVRVQAKFDTADYAQIANKLLSGYTVEYKFYQKKAANSTYKFTKAKNANYITYTKKTLKKGTKYNFQVGVVVKDAEGTVIATKDYKASGVGVRTVK